MEKERFERDWLEWLTHVMMSRPVGNLYLDSERGIEIGKLCLEIAREDFTWRRSDKDTFWADVQLFTKYKLDEKDINFICKMQPGVDNYKLHAKERNAYAEMMRGINKLRKLNQQTMEKRTEEIDQDYENGVIPKVENVV